MRDGANPKIVGRMEMTSFAAFPQPSINNSEYCCTGLYFDHEHCSKEGQISGCCPDMCSTA